jgi:hypothetical protein
MSKMFLLLVEVYHPLCLSTILVSIFLYRSYPFSCSGGGEGFFCLSLCPLELTIHKYLLMLKVKPYYMLNSRIIRCTLFREYMLPHC